MDAEKPGGAEGVTPRGSAPILSPVTGNDDERAGTMRRIAWVLITGLAAGCASEAPPPDLEAPPTEEDFRYIGGDALDSYFLTRWRRCTQFASTSTCLEEIYGGDGGGYP